MRRIKQRILSAVAALSLLATAFPTVPAQAGSLSTEVQEPFRSDVSFSLPGGTSVKSDSYRIPAMVTLDNGTIVAAADIRWNTTYDGGGLDTITARSTDGGVSWNYTVANYLGDNGNTYNGSKSTCFIDPCLVVGKDGNTVYMLVDLYPYGIALNGSGNTQPSTDIGFDSNGNLLLRYNNSQKYDYYLDMDDYIIYTSKGISTGIQVDPYFNYTTSTAAYGLRKPAEATEPAEDFTEPTKEATVPAEETVPVTEETIPPTEETVPSTEETVPPSQDAGISLRETLLGGLAIKASAAEYDPNEGILPAADETYNLFFEDSPYKVARTGYLYLTKSTDGGVSWSAPTLLNLKNSAEMVCLVGPGRGITTSEGKMVIPVYSYNGSNASQYMGFLYSSGGENWIRVNSNFGIWSSESAVVELANGNLRFFFRNGEKQLCYADYSFDTGWSSVRYSGIPTNSNTQISAITYSQKSDGNQVILVSCPAGSSGGSNSSSAADRINGRIYVFTDDGSTMTHVNTVNVNSGNFMYSCLTERSDGSVAILYEDAETAWGVGGRYEMEMKAYTAEELGLSFGNSGGNGGGSGEGDDPEDPAGSETLVLQVDETRQASAILPGTFGTAGTHTTQDGVAKYTIAHNDAVTHPDSTARLGTNSSYTGETVNLHQALYTFTGTNAIGFTIQNGSVYLGIDGGRNPGYPGSTTNTERLALVKSNYTTYGSNGFNIKNISSARYLYFWRNGQNRFDKQSSAAAETAFLIYAPVDASHTSSSELPGYYQITSADQIQSGGKYLIAANVSGTYFILYPSTSTTSYYAHVAKATGTETACIDQAAGTVVTFTGLKPGQTTVTVGSTVYTVTVESRQESIDVPMPLNSSSILNPVADLGLSSVDYTVSYQVVSGSSVSVNATGNLTAGSVPGNTVITATVMKGDVILGTVTYEISVSEVVITDTKSILVPVDGKAVISGLSGNMYTGSLSTDIATVTQSGTGVTINGVKPGDTSVIVGTTRINIRVVPKNTDPNRENTVKYLYASVEAIEHCDVYYSVNGSPLYKIQGTGILLDQTYYGGCSISLYAAPHPGYALTDMHAEGSDHQYYALTYEGDISNSPAWPLAADGVSYKSDASGFQWALKEGNVTKERLKEVFDEAIALGCHGAQTFTKNANGTETNNASNRNNLNTKLSYIAEPLPDFTKQIIGYKRSGTPSAADQANGKLTLAGYTDYFKFDNAVSLEFGDSLLYQFTVTSSSSLVNYTDIVLQDTQIGYTKTIPNNTLDTQGTRFYYAEYTIQRKDLEKYTGGKFVNNAQLSYQYSSRYSTGVYGGNASSEATCDIIGVVSYAWEEGTPQAIVTNADGRYTLPGSFSLVVGETFRITEYTGRTTYTETVDGFDVTWNYDGRWGVRRYGEDQMIWFLASTALNTDFTMENARSITFYGRWKPSYTVAYQWEGEHPNLALPQAFRCPVGDTYSVDDTFREGDTHNDGTFLWTFQGWKQANSTAALDGTIQTMGSGHAIYTGSWTKTDSVASLTVQKTGCDTADVNQSFLFHISGNGTELDVVIHGNGSVTVSGLAVGKTYTVTENTEWSWRYTPKNAEKSVTIVSTGNTVTFENVRGKSGWLSGGAWCDNRFTGAN